MFFPRWTFTRRKNALNKLFIRTEHRLLRRTSGEFLPGARVTTCSPVGTVAEAVHESSTEVLRKF